MPASLAFQQAINAVFDPGADPAVQQQANIWLNTFTAAPEAWDTCLAILQPAVTAPNVLFFAANMLLSKTRSEWGKLPEERRSQLAASVRFAGRLAACRQKIRSVQEKASKIWLFMLPATVPSSRSACDIQCQICR